MTTLAWAYLLIGYLAGSIPFAYLMGRFKGGNIFAQGSGNPGATNTLVVFGKKAAAAVLILDVLKGLVPAYLAGRLTGDYTIAFWAGAGAVLGHAFSIFTKFKGGKALATAGGALLYLAPIPLLIVIGSYLLLLFLTRYIVFATTLVILGAVGYFLYLDMPLTDDLALLTMVVGVLFRHLPNWERMYLRNEPKVGEPVEEIKLQRLPREQQVLLQIGYFVCAALVYAAVVLLR